MKKEMDYLKIESKSSELLKSNDLTLSKESWFNIFSYIDLQSFLNLEKASKYFRKLSSLYYLEKNTFQFEKDLYSKKLLGDNQKPSKFKENSGYLDISNLFGENIKLGKKNMIEKVSNCIIQIPYTLIEFCGIYSNKSFNDLIKNNTLKINDINIDINENLNCSSDLDSWNNNLHSYKAIEFINNTKFMIFNNNSLNVYETDINNNFIRSYFQIFKESNIRFFGFIQNELFLIDDEGYLTLMNPTNYATNIQKIRFYLPEIIEQIYFIKQYFIFLTKESNFYYIEFEDIFSKEKKNEDLENWQIELLSVKFSKNDNCKNKLFPKKINKNYNGILDISVNNNNFILFIDKNYELFGLKKSDEAIGKNEEGQKHNNNIEKDKNNLIFFYKICETKFPNYFTMSHGDNYWILLEQRYLIPLIYWDTPQVLEWFEKELGYEEYLNVIK